MMRGDGYVPNSQLHHHQHPQPHLYPYSFPHHRMPRLDSLDSFQDEGDDAAASSSSVLMSESEWQEQQRRHQEEEEEEAQKKSKLDETEVISLLRSLYLKSGNEKAAVSRSRDGQEDRKARPGRSHTRKSLASRKIATSTGSNRASQRQSKRNIKHKSNSKKSRNGNANADVDLNSNANEPQHKHHKKKLLGIFGGGRRKIQDESVPPPPPTGQSRTSWTGSGNKNKNKDKAKRRGLFGRTIKVPKKQQEEEEPQPSNFEFLNEPSPCAGYNGPPPPPPASYGDSYAMGYSQPPPSRPPPYPLTPAAQEEYYARMQTGYPPNMNMNMNMSANQTSTGPAMMTMNHFGQHQHYQYPTNHHYQNASANANGNSIPQRVRGEPIVSDLTIDTTHHHSSDINGSDTPQNANNTVQGTPVGPPRVNSIRGTLLSPIVEAEDSTKKGNNAAIAEEEEWEQHNNTRLPSPPGVVSTMKQPLQQHQQQEKQKQLSSSIAAEEKKNSENNININKKDNSASPNHDQWSLPLFPVASPTDTESPPRDIVIDPVHSKRPSPYHHNYRRGSGVGPDHEVLADKDTIISDVSSNEHYHHHYHKDILNRSPNSVMSQFVKELEPHPQCLIRGSRLYDAAYYAMNKLCCDGYHGSGGGGGSKMSKKEKLKSPLYDHHNRHHMTNASRYGHLHPNHQQEQQQHQRYMAIEPDYGREQRYSTTPRTRSPTLTNKAPGPSYNKYHHHDEAGAGGNSPQTYQRHFSRHV